jgi:guanylate kinase
MILTLTGRPGSGSTTLMDRLMKLEKRFSPIVSVTTRAPKKSDLNKMEFVFVSRAEFDRMQKRGDFQWDVELFGNRYGTPKTAVTLGLQHNAPFVAIVQLKGVVDLYEEAARQNRLEEVHSIYLDINDEIELRRRLRKRGDPAEEVSRRSKAPIGALR